MNDITLIATSAFGLEAAVAREVEGLGYGGASVESGKVAFTAEPAAICRANLWLRVADRVLVKMGEFPARTFDELFEGTKALPWTDWLPGEACFPVTGKALKSQLMSVPDCQAIVKKAIVERMKTRHATAWFPETGPLYRIEVSLLKDVATLTLDTTGAGLHKRGYRTLSAQAPLKETLAASLILLSRWRADEPLLDPFCGSGTIPIEAALIGLNIAPGIRRTFTAETWPQLPQASWREARSEAADLARPEQRLRIDGSDIDPGALSLANYHARQAGVARDISLRNTPLSAIRLNGPHGRLIGNPPYGERIGEIAEVEEICRQLGRLHCAADDWSFYILTAHPAFERLFGRKADKRRKLYNGRLECQYYQYFG